MMSAATTALPKPRPMPVLAENIPGELKALSRWVNWSWKWNGKKWDKPPLQRDGSPAKSNDPTTWTSFDEALTGHCTGRFDGIGMVVDDPYVVIDLDDCIDPEIGAFTLWGSEFIGLLDSYTEESPSHTGVKSWVRGKKPGDRTSKNYQGGKVEMFVAGSPRYCTITGRALEGTPTTINERQAAVTTIYNKVFVEGNRQAGHATSNGEAGHHFTDVDLIEKIKASANGDKFSRLWAGDTGDYQGDDSRADLALCGMLGFWCQGDAARIDALFRQSGLMRAKWERQDYRDRTIAKALEGKSEFYHPPKGGTVPGHAPPPAGGQEAHPASSSRTGYEIILEHFKQFYRPLFRRGPNLYSEALERDVSPAEACYAPDIQLVEALRIATDVPRYKDGTVNRQAVPAFFANWAKSAFVVLRNSLAEEDDSAEVNELARDQFRAKVAAAMLCLQSFVYEYKKKEKSDPERTEVQKRSLLNWCQLWAKAGNWQSVRSLPLWTRLDEQNRLCIALRLELFAVLSKPIPAKGPKAFKRLCHLYDVGTGGRPCGKDAVELSGGFLDYLSEQPTVGVQAVVDSVVDLGVPGNGAVGGQSTSESTT
jgi:hypothetical protein